VGEIRVTFVIISADARINSCKLLNGTRRHRGEETVNIFGRKKAVPDVDVEEPEFALNATTGDYAKDSGWEYWNVYPRQMRLRHDRCSGGPPRHEDIYEYAVRHTSVFVRLLERSEEDDEPVYTVFDGSILQARLEEDYASKVKKYEKADVKMKELMLSDTPTVIAAALQKETAWHEIYGAVRYFILSKHANATENRSFFMDEHRRYEEAFASFAKQVEELGAVWSDTFYRYEAAEGATAEAKENVATKLRVYNFGFRNRREFMEKDVILSVLKDAIK
jgi:hypothetical protein